MSNLTTKIRNMLKNDAVFTSSGSSALILSLKALNLPKESEVLIPAYCCSNVPFSILVCNLKPVFVDINIETLLFDKESLKSSLSKNTAAVIGIHPFGRSMDLDFISNFARENDIVFIEDFCQSFGGVFQNKLHGEFGDISITSFGKGKIIDVGYGGAIITKEKELKNKIKKLTISLPPNLSGFGFEKYRRIFEELCPSYFKKIGINGFPLAPILYNFLYKFNPSFFHHKISDNQIKIICDAAEDIEDNIKKRLSLFSKLLLILRDCGDKFKVYFHSNNVYMYFSFYVNINIDILDIIKMLDKDKYYTTIRRAYVSPLEKMYGTQSFFDSTHKVRRNIINIPLSSYSNSEILRSGILLKKILNYDTNDLNKLMAAKKAMVKVNK